MGKNGFTWAAISLDLILIEREGMWIWGVSHWVPSLYHVEIINQFQKLASDHSDSIGSYN